MRGRGHVAGPPELELFPTDEAREKALQEIEHSMLPRWNDGWGWVKFSAIVLTAIAVPYLVITWISDAMSPLSEPWKSRVELLLTVIVYIEVIFLLLRRDVPRSLRKKLLEAGVPVCLACGYSLRGLPANTERCPECGKRIVDRVKALMQSATSESGDS